MKRNKIISVIMVMSIVFSFSKLRIPDPVRADAAPEPGAIGSTLFPNINQTMVRMEAETVLMTIPEHSDYWSGHAIVTATFYMRNMGDETEEMKARFPMNSNEYDLQHEAINGDEYCRQISDFPSIEDLTVKIDGEETEMTTTTRTFEDWWSTKENPSYSTVNCWAHFDVSFPPGEQVIIEVQYKVAGYKSDLRFVSYKYILQTGAGWYDTIGSADIVVKLPYDLDDTLVETCKPEDCIIQENTVWWHYEDFEPEHNIEIRMLEPSIWSRVVRETFNVQKNTSDGEAWGRLGMAYKELVTERHGMIVASEYPDFFEKGVNAYKNAVYLLPNDAEWHLGYSDLVCPYAVEAYYFHLDDGEQYAKICGIEIDTVLYLNPGNPDVIQYLKYLYESSPEFFIDNGFNIFAKKINLPTLEVIPTKFLALTTNTPDIMYSGTATPDIPEKTNTPVVQISSAEDLTPTVNPFGEVQPQEPFKHNTGNQKQIWFSFVGNILLLGMTVLVYSIRRRRQKSKK